MKAGLKKLRDSAVNRVLGIELRETTIAFQQSLERNSAWQEALVTELRGELAFIKRRLSVQVEQLRAELDGTHDLRVKLKAARANAQYALAFSEPEPLVSVRIHTFNRTDELVNVALASVLSQSYERFEVVIVNDGPNDATRRAVKGLRNPKIRFIELAERGTYPIDQRSRWMVAGTSPANRAIEEVAGQWIAPLDDDDSFTPDHIGKLLLLAREKQVELAYGSILQKNRVNGDEQHIWSYPPEISQFSFQGALYHRALRLFRYDSRSWMLDEPGDWNLIRRMSDAGVTMAATEDVVATVNMVPYTHKDRYSSK